MDPPIVIFVPCIITPKIDDISDAQGKICYDNNKLKCANPVSSFSKKEKNETFEEFKLGDTNTREDLNIEKSNHIHESIIFTTREIGNNRCQMVLVSLPKHFIKQIYHENLLLTIKFGNLFLHRNLTVTTKKKKLNNLIVKKQTKNHPIDHPLES